jgi:hypothetical protein
MFFVNFGAAMILKMFQQKTPKNVENCRNLGFIFFKI